MRTLIIGLAALVVTAISSFQFSRSDHLGAESKAHFQDERYEVKWAYLNWSCPLREQAVEKLAQGERTLLETAAYFEAIESHRPADMPSIHNFISGSSGEERICRHVIAHTKSSLRWPEYQRAELVDRLQAELDERLAEGSLRLPCLPPDCLPPKPPQAD